MTDWFIIVERRAPGSIERVTGVKKPKRDNREISTEEQENSTEISDLDRARREQETQSSETGGRVSQAVFNTLMMRQASSQSAAVAPVQNGSTMLCSYLPFLADDKETLTIWS